MTSFLNIDFEKPIKLKFLFKHILFSVLWALGLAIFLFRADLSIQGILNQSTLWFVRLIPFIYLALVLIVMFTSKWYYTIALLLYPLLIFFWFLPKQILARGKIYLLSNYIGNVIHFIKTLRFSITKTVVYVFTIFLLLITDSNVIRIVGIVVFSFFYFNYVINYIRKSLNPPKLFGADISKAIENILAAPDKRFTLVSSIEDRKTQENQNPDQIKSKKLEDLIYLNYFITYLRDNLSGFGGKKAFLISWVYQLTLFLTITVAFYTFVNFELYIINANNFDVVGIPKFFDFLYYTIKTITFSNIEIIQPLSVIVRVVEILSFITLGIFSLIFTVSIIYSLRQERFNENIKQAKEFCLIQDKIISDHIREKYNTDIQTVLNESSNIKNSLFKLKKVIERLF